MREILLEKQLDDILFFLYRSPPPFSFYFIHLFIYGIFYVVYTLKCTTRVAYTCTRAKKTKDGKKGVIVNTAF